MAIPRTPFNCQHCAAAILRSSHWQLTCPRCGSTIWVPPADSRRRCLTIGRQRYQVRGPNYPCRWGRVPLVVDHWLEPAIATFDRHYGVREALDHARNEFEAQVRLRHLVRERWFAVRPPKAILKRYGFWQANRGNDYWFCTHVSRMFVLAATAAGFQARILNVARRTHGMENCFGHMVTDIWSNQYQRWIYMDPLMDFHYEDESGQPLSALQARSLYFRDDARGLYHSTLRNRKGVTAGRYPLAAPHLDEVTKSLHVRSSNLFWCLYYHGQNYFRRPLEQRQVPILRFRDDLNRHSRLTSDGVELYTQEPMIEETEASLDVEPLLCNAEIHICRPRGHDAAVAYVATQMPNLQCIRYRVDASRWRRLDVDGLSLALPQHGETTLEAQAISHLGQRSRVSKVVLSRS